jgi:hypothetical protein
MQGMCSSTTSAVDLFKASVIRNTDFIIFGKQDASPGLTVFLGNMQLFLFSASILKP